MRRVIPMAAVLALTITGCGSPDPAAVNRVARVGNRSIDAGELTRSYALYPQWKRGDRALQSYLVQLDALVTEKLYAQEAEKLGIDRDTLMVRHCGFLRQKELIKALYRKHVANSIRISEPEERSMYARAKRKVDFEYVIARDSARTAAAMPALMRGDVASLPSDSLLARGRKVRAVVGSVPPEIEQALFTARLHDVLGPLRTQSGYVGIHITGGEQEKFLSEDDFLRERPKFNRILRDRKQDSVAALYIYGLMRDKDLRLNGPVFWGAAQWFGRRVREAHVDPMNIQSVYVTGDEIRLLARDLAPAGNDVIASHRNGTLTVRELLRALEDMPGALRPRVRTPLELKDAIGRIVRNQYLAREAEREGLENDEEFRREYAIQRDEALAGAYEEQRRSGARVTPDEVAAYRKTLSTSEEQVFFQLDMAALARTAKTDSLLRMELPRLKAAYRIAVDTLRIRALCTAPDDVVREEPLRVYVREVFQ